MGAYETITVGDKGTIKVEITPTKGLNTVSGETVLSQMEDAFDEAMNTIRVCATGFVESVSDFSSKATPQEISLEFGLAFKAEAGIVITKTSGEATLKVELTWKKSE